MSKGFDDLDDSSPFMVEPTYDPQHGGWMTNEMRVHLKILQTGTVNQVDLSPTQEECAPRSEDDALAPAMAPQLYEELPCNWATDESVDDTIPRTEPDDQSAAHGVGKEAAIQCTLLGDPLGYDPIEGSNTLGYAIQTGFGIHRQDPLMYDGSCPGSQASTASLIDKCDLDPLTSCELGRAELAHSCHLVRLSQPITWAQRKWPPFPDDQGGLGF